MCYIIVSFNIMLYVLSKFAYSHKFQVVTYFLSLLILSLLYMYLLSLQEYPTRPSTPGATGKLYSLNMSNGYSAN